MTHIVASVDHGGIAGRTEIWTTPAGQRREDITLGFLHETYIFDGTRGWYVDRNGWTRALAGGEVDDENNFAFIDSGAALLPERRAGAVSRTPSGELVLAPAGSRTPTVVELDPATHLPRAFRRRHGVKHYRVEFSDWREVDGVRMPFATRSRDDEGHDAAAIVVERVDHAGPPPDAFSPPRHRGASDVAFASPSGLVEMPIQVVTGGIVIVKATVAGHELDFILDTGSEGSALNAARLPELHLAGTGTFAAGAAGGDTMISYVPHVTFELPGVTLRDQTVAAIHLEQLEPMFGRPIGGILGYDFVSRFVVEIDYPQSTLRLHDRAHFTHDAARAIPITLEGSLPWSDATVEVPGHDPLVGRFTLDTGCTCQVSFNTPFTDGNHLLDSIHAAQVGAFAGAGGETRAVSSEITALRIGPVSIERPVADFARDDHGATADPDTAGLIGAETFRRFVLVLDYAGERMWLDPAS